MKEITIDDINLLNIGHSIQISGMIFSGYKQDYLIYLPDEFEKDNEKVILHLTPEDWKAFLKQTDILETEILTEASDGTLAKVILRKSQRQIDQYTAWRVFKKDNYSCRYCGRDTVPLTVDHLILWEEGGPSTEENMISACKKCNKTRGSMQYEDWLNSEYYKRVSQNLSEETHYHNAKLVSTLSKIPRRVHQQSR